jgi:hypothetical protein
MRIRSIVLLLCPGLAACASGMHPATRFGPAEGVEVRFPRVAPRTLVARLDQPAHANVLEVTPESDTPAHWLGEATPLRLRAGSHTLFMGEGSPLVSADQRICDRPGERLWYDWMAAPGPVSDMRTVEVRGRTYTCIRQPASLQRTRERHLLVLVAPRAGDAAALERARDAFNRRHAGSPSGPKALAQALAQAIVAQWPGSTAYYVSVRA